MAGIHKYSSSLFIQSGAVAQFKNGISSSGLNVEGTVYASGYFNLAGEPITSGDASVFFAGDPGSPTLGVSRSAANGGPESKDTFISMNSSNTTSDVLNEGILSIGTTGSLSFKPNFFNFLKVGDLNSNLITVQQGGLDKRTYVPGLTDPSEIVAGVHKYIIYAAETGSSGETHQVFHTITLDQFVNNPPTLQPANNTSFTLNLDHDINSGSLVLNFTDSSDIDQISNQGGDFLKFFTASRDNNDPTTIDTSNNTYALTLGHNVDEAARTINSKPAVGLTDVTPGLAKDFRTTNKSILGFTASLSNYDAILNNTNTIFTSTTQTEPFTVTLKDSYFDLSDETLKGVVIQNYTLDIVPPPTASINNFFTLFEGQNNTEGFKDTQQTSHTHTVLYDFTGSLDSSSINNYHDRYTSSLIRIKNTANIVEPTGYNASQDHYTFVRIQSSSTNNIASNSPTVGYFRFEGGTVNAVATAFSDTMGEGYSTLQTLNGGFSNETYNQYKDIIVKYDENYTSSQATDLIRYFGATTDSTAINDIQYVKHGNHDHHSASANTQLGFLTLQKCPDILIDNINVEVESGSAGWPIGPQNHFTSSLLYGLTSSLSGSSQISNFLGGFINSPNYDTYLSQ